MQWPTACCHWQAGQYRSALLTGMLLCKAASRGLQLMNVRAVAPGEHGGLGQHVGTRTCQPSTLFLMPGVIGGLARG